MFISKTNIKPEISTKQKNGGIPPKCPDERLRYVTAACGKCYECRKQKARAWLVRMQGELRHDNKAIFVIIIECLGIIKKDIDQHVIQKNVEIKIVQIQLNLHF